MNKRKNTYQKLTNHLTYSSLKSNNIFKNNDNENNNKNSINTGNSNNQNSCRNSIRVKYSRVPKNRVIKVHRESMNPIQRIRSEFRNKNYNSEKVNTNEITTPTPFGLNEEPNNELNSNSHRNTVTNNYLHSEANIEKEIIDLQKEKENLTKNNMHLLEILNLNTKKNKELKDYISNYKNNVLETKLKYIKSIEKLKQKSTEINYELENNKFDKKLNSSTDLTQIKKENILLEKKILQKNNDFRNLNELMLDLLSSNENFIKDYQKRVNDLDMVKNNNLIGHENINNSREVISLKNEYEKLKIQYNELLEKENNEKKDISGRKVKFVTRDISEITKNEYENKINELIDSNKKISVYYTNEINKIKKEIENTKQKYDNKEREVDFLVEKYKIIIETLTEKIQKNGVQVNEENEI